MPMNFPSLPIDEHGFVGPMMAIAALPVMGMVGMAIDHGRQSHTTTDIYAIVEEACDRSTSVYFASRTVDERVDAADVILQRRTGGLREYSGVVFTASPQGQLVEVAASGTIDTTLAALIGINELPINISYHCGEQQAAQTGPACAVVLNPDVKRALHVHEGMITAPGCEVHVRSTDKEAAVIHKKSTLNTSKFCVAGEIINGPFIESGSLPEEYVDDGSSVINGTSEMLCPTTSNPYAARNIPDQVSCDYTNFVASAPMANLKPGIYCGGMTISANVRARLRAGEYYIVDGELNVATGATFEGDGVSIILQGSNSGIVTEGAFIRLTPPVSGQLAEMVIFQESSQPNVKVEFKKMSNVSLSGIVHLPNSDLKVDASVMSADVGGYLKTYSSKLDVHGGSLTLAMP